jgi:hypothetical protein
MKIKIPGKTAGETMWIVEDCARAAGHFVLRNTRTEGRYALFVLRMANSTPGQKDRRQGHEGDERRHHGLMPDVYAYQMRYRKRGIGHMMHGRGPEYGVAVCFHGFRAFMRDVYKRHPEAIIRTCRAAYLGSEDFEAKWPAVGRQNVGSQCAPVMYARGPP